jgi:hypothetical protein
MLDWDVNAGSLAFEVLRSNSLNAPRLRWTLESLFQKLGGRCHRYVPVSEVRFLLFADGGSSGQSLGRHSRVSRCRFFERGISSRTNMGVLRGNGWYDSEE